MIVAYCLKLTGRITQLRRQVQIVNGDNKNVRYKADRVIRAHHNNNPSKVKDKLHFCREIRLGKQLVEELDQMNMIIDTFDPSMAINTRWYSYTGPVNRQVSRNGD